MRKAVFVVNANRNDDGWNVNVNDFGNDDRWNDDNRGFSRNSLFLPFYSGSFSFSIPIFLFHPPIIFPGSVSVCESIIYFLSSKTPISQATCRNIFKQSIFVTAVFI